MARGIFGGCQPLAAQTPVPHDVALDEVLACLRGAFGDSLAAPSDLGRVGCHVAGLRRRSCALVICVVRPRAVRSLISKMTSGCLPTRLPLSARRTDSGSGLRLDAGGDTAFWPLSANGIPRSRPKSCSVATTVLRHTRIRFRLLFVVVVGGAMGPARKARSTCFPGGLLNVGVESRPHVFQAVEPGKELLVTGLRDRGGKCIGDTRRCGIGVNDVARSLDS